MITSTTVKVTYSNSKKYYIALGYPDLKQGSVVDVLLEHLPKNSNKIVHCECDKCGVQFERSYQLIVKQRPKQNQVDLCQDCARKRVGEVMDTKNIVAAAKTRIGPKHPRWRKDKDEFKRYASEVRKYTEKQPIYLLENSDKPRTLCGVEGGYQLDHCVSIRRGYELGLHPKYVGSLVNLRFIPWAENRKKSTNSSIVLEVNSFKW